MKFLLSLLAAVSLVSSLQAGLTSSGSLCESLNYGFVNAFYASPAPIDPCGTQSIYTTVTFNGNYYVDQIVIRQIYNQATTYDQIIPNAEFYGKNQQVTFALNFNAFQCTPGDYIIQVIIQTHLPNRWDLSCWQYTYSA